MDRNGFDMVNARRSGTGNYGTSRNDDNGLRQDICAITSPPRAKSPAITDKTFASGSEAPWVTASDRSEVASASSASGITRPNPGGQEESSSGAHGPPRYG